MKPSWIKIVALLCLAFFIVSFAPNDDDVIYYKVDPYPAFSYKGINETGEACKAYFSERVIISNDKKDELFGRIYIQFIVEKDGSLSHFKLLHGVDRKLDKKAMHAVKSMPRWNPGFRNGKPVRTWYAVAVKWVYQE